MNRREIEELAVEEAGKIVFDGRVEVELEDSDPRYCLLGKHKIYVRLFPRDYCVNVSPAHITFGYHQNRRSVNCFSLWVDPDLRKVGYGRALVETMERFAKRAECRTARVIFDDNPSFWKHMKYMKRGKFRKKSFSEV